MNRWNGWVDVRDKRVRGLGGGLERVEGLGGWLGRNGRDVQVKGFGGGS